MVAADQTHPLELVRLVHDCVTNSGFLFQLQPASRWIPAQNLQHPLTLGTPALRARWRVEVELLDRMGQQLETKSASSSSSCWGSRRWGSPASSCASSRGSSTSTRRAQLEVRPMPSACGSEMPHECGPGASEVLMAAGLRLLLSISGRQCFTSQLTVCLLV